VNDPFKDGQQAPLLAQAIVDTVRESLLVLDAGLRVVAASRYFYRSFNLVAANTVGQLIYDLADGQFNILDLRYYLENLIPGRTATNEFEIEATFAGIGHRTLIINTREIFYEGGKDKTILLAFEDITERRRVDREKEILLARTEDLLKQKEILLEEMQKRIANSLEIIASILLLKAQAVTSEETKRHLQDAHRRVISVATVQQHIHAAARGELIEVGTYLSKLCDSLGDSMISSKNKITLRVFADSGAVKSDQAVSFGLIITELVINALKHAFPETRPDAEVVVSYETNGANWQLAVSDNGIGRQRGDAAPAKGGLGTSLVEALAKQYDAHVETMSSPAGLRVTVTRVQFESRLLRRRA
jgi:chemotaxis protein methyltransferase CheR